MNRSSKFNFFLPQNTDPIEVSDFNSNFETIDANLLTKAQSLTDAQKSAVRANVDLNVANNLTTTAAGSVLDARQGKLLNDAVSQRANYRAVDVSSYAFNTEAGAEAVFSALPSSFVGVCYAVFVNGYKAVCLVTKTSSSYGSITYSVDYNQIPFYYAKNGSNTIFGQLALKSGLVSERRSTTDVGSISANSVKSIHVNVSKAGYTPVGIIAVSGSGTTGLILQEFYISSNEAVVYYRNITSSAITPTSISVVVLYSMN